MEQRPSGYVLVTTLIIMSLCVALLTGVMRRSFVFQDRARFDLNREKARLLALSGLEIALAQLAVIVPKQEKKPSETPPSPTDPGPKAQDAKDQPKKEEKLSPSQQFIMQVTPLLNVWQQFKFTQEQGVEGTVQIYLACEQGKININRLVDKDAQADGSVNQTTQEPPATTKPADKTKPAQTPEKDTKKTYADVITSRLENYNGAHLLQALSEARRKLGRPLEDPTELLGIPSVAGFEDNIFIMPPSGQTKPQKPPLFLMDLCTTLTSMGSLNPWLLSASTARLLGLNPLNGPPAAAGALEQKPLPLKERAKKLREFFIKWQSEWDTLLAPIYGKKFAELPKEISSMFASKFDASLFSVMSYGQVGTTTQKLCGIVKRITPPAGVSDKSYIFKIIKIYWL